MPPLLPLLVMAAAAGAAAASASACDGCPAARETARQRHLDAIKGEILRRMGFARPPNITGKALPSIPGRYLERLGLDAGVQGDEPFRTGFQVTEEDDEYHVRTQRVLTFAQAWTKWAHPKRPKGLRTTEVRNTKRESNNSRRKDPRLRHGWRGHDVLRFTFTDSITKFHVANATLHVFVRGAGRPGARVRLEVFKVTRVGDGHQLARVADRALAQPSGAGDWAAVDFTETVGEWFKSPRDNLGFVFNVTVDGRRVAAGDGDGDKVPYVEISTTEAKRRVRRNLGLNCDDKMNEPLCCRYPLTVDFEEIGFDFIIAPKRYEAHMCSGECPYVTLQKYAHTHLMRIAQPNSAAPCCAPRKVSPISMLYFDEQLNVVYGSLPGMVVDRCGCS